MTDTPTSVLTVRGNDGDASAEEILSLHTGFDGVRLTDLEPNGMAAVGDVETKKIPKLSSMLTTITLTVLLVACSAVVAIALSVWCVTALRLLGVLLTT